MPELKQEIATWSIEHMSMAPSDILHLQNQGVKTIGEGLAYLYAAIDQRLRGKKQKKYEFWFKYFMLDLAERDSLPDKLVDEIYELIFTYPLDWLQCFQEKDGHWSNDFEFTVAATLAMIRAGHTATKGRFAYNVARAMRWLEMERPLTDSTITYGLLRVFAEHYGMPYPEPPFELPQETAQTQWRLEETRRYALLKGNAPRLPRDISHWKASEHDRRWEIASLYTDLELAWMVVGPPRRP
jgi:hypothetical protein